MLVRDRHSSICFKIVNNNIYNNFDTEKNLMVNIYVFGMPYYDRSHNIFEWLYQLMPPI
jgi:hypothetical protein